MVAFMRVDLKNTLYLCRPTFKTEKNKTGTSNKKIKSRFLNILLIEL